MSTAALSAGAAVSLPAARRTISPWLIAIAVVVPTFMEVLDTTIANVALRYIAGVTADEQAVSDLYANLMIVGTPAQVRARIEDVVAQTAADEVMVVTHAYEVAARIRSYELVAQAFGLGTVAQ